MCVSYHQGPGHLSMGRCRWADVDGQMPNIWMDVQDGGMAKADTGSPVSCFNATLRSAGGSTAKRHVIPMSLAVSLIVQNVSVMVRTVNWTVGRDGGTAIL